MRHTVQQNVEVLTLVQSIDHFYCATLSSHSSLDHTLTLSLSLSLSRFLSLRSIFYRDLNKQL